MGVLFVVGVVLFFVCFFVFNDTATTEIYTLSLHDALPISITLGWTRAGTVLTYDVIIVNWDDTWGIQANHSMVYNLGGSPSSLTNWTAVDGGTPGW